MKKISMKKLLAGLAVAAIFVGLCAIPTSAKKITVLYNGEELSFDVSPKIQNDRVMVPMRTIFETFGAKVKWDGESKTVTAKKKSDTIEMMVDSLEVKKNDEVVTVDAAPAIEDGRTLIPLRAVSELLELEVDWNEKTKTVTINESEEEKDESWKENKGEIELTKFTVTGDGNSAENGVITITEAGDYTVTGKCEDSQILIDSEGKVKLRLSGMSLTNKNGAAIYVKDADKAYITITEDTENYLSDGETYENDDEKGTITAKENLEIKGKGSLTVNGECNNGIHASDSLTIENGNIEITAKNDAIHVNDTLEISGGNLNITAYGDGVQADDIVEISDGTINIETKGDVPAATNAKHFGKEEKTEEEDNSVSSKGIKADWLMEISGGTINITSTDHAIHSASDIVIDGGDITINSDNKGISAHGNLTINGGSFNIPKASEGIESKQIMTINDGEFYIIAGDDGLNAGGGEGFGGFGGGMPFMRNENEENGEMPKLPDGESVERGMRQRNTENGEMPDFKRDGAERDRNGMPDFKNGEMPDFDRQDMGEMKDFAGGRRGRRDMNGDMLQMPPEMSGNGDMPPQMSENGTMQQGRGMGVVLGNSDEESTEHHIQINGGSFYICAVNDGIDANGSITITGGTVVVEGRSVAAGGELGLDADKKITISGGEVLAAGSIVYDSGAEQNTALINLSKSAGVGAHFEIKDAKGNTVAEIKSVKKAFSQILYSSDKLEAGKTYSVYVDNELSDTFTQENGITSVGTAQSSGFGGGMGRKMQ